MNFLTKIKNWLEKEINTDWRIVALDLNRALIDLQEKYQQANQRIADLENIVAIYEGKEKAR
ncbi:hypothetical protein HMPREF1516_0744 [Streptococcus sp. CM6]|uniref:hypothetical protein n=1 Tax=Streptococcus sp. CM6 TaxID=936580 RepID=UPI0004530535|nr:hypothetical protein [Streptococcus sp. CM6]EUC81255.1 hypothetical protein HMPREF1516_0744 [Streptococcus sp. CM6]